MPYLRQESDCSRFGRSRAFLTPNRIPVPRPGGHAGGRERMRSWVVDFRAPALPDTERLRAAAAEKDRSVRERCVKTVHVRIEHGDGMPGAVGIVFRRHDGLESGGVTAQEGDFAVQDEGAVAAARDVQVRKALYTHGLPLRAVRPRQGMPSGLGPGASGGQNDRRQYEGLVLHFPNITIYPLQGARCDLRTWARTGTASPLHKTADGRRRLQSRLRTPSNIRRMYQQQS